MRTLVLLALGLPFLAHAQNDYLANDPVWTNTAVCGDMGGGGGGMCVSTDTYNYRLDGDSLIGVYTYSKVMRSGSVSLAWQGGPPPPPPACTGTSVYGPQDAGLLRQDGLRLYAWDGDSDELLYDFDLEVGETLPVTMNNWNTDITVTAIDSLLVGTEWRKRFALANSWAPFLIEGIGSSNGLFEPLSNFLECGYSLDCFGLDTVGYYPGPGPNCSLAMGVAQVSIARSNLTVSPNPVNDMLSISGVDPQHMGFVRLFDVQGCERLQGALYRENMTLDMSAIPGGVYVLVVGDQRQQVVVTH
ncbi:MAG: T9SS type A sorting domain-containing protein [Flavobacteriales bacterium]|nr:T9SS type A sorting domain-containing protein [Flavobacteriales bacterium]